MARPPKLETDQFVPGEWNAVCFECGIKKKSGFLRKHWQGYYVCPKHWEVRHPQDFTKAIPDNMSAPWVQPEPADVFAPVIPTPPFGGSTIITTESLINITTETGIIFVTEGGVVPASP